MTLTVTLLWALYYDHKPPEAASPDPQTHNPREEQPKPNHSHPRVAEAWANTPPNGHTHIEMEQLSQQPIRAEYIEYTVKTLNGSDSKELDRKTDLMECLKFCVLGDTFGCVWDEAMLPFAAQTTKGFIETNGCVRNLKQLAYRHDSQ